MTAIDVHNHIVPADFPAPPGSGTVERWPCMQEKGGGKAAIVIAGKEFRALDERSWDPARRVADMDAEGTDIQVLSPMPELLSYWLTPQQTLAMVRHVNATIAAMIAAAPRRFAGLGMVPLQDPELAAKELSALKRSDGLLGVEIGSNINGRVPGDPFFEPFFAEAERLDLAVFVHALHPVGTDRLVGPSRLVPFVTFPIDTGLAAASMITGGTLAKFPRLRLAFSHGGGILGAILPRLAHGWRIDGALGERFASPRETARRFFYDNLVFDARLLAYLIETFGATQIFLGSDYPYAGRQENPRATLDALKLGAAEMEALAGGNARRFLGL